MGEKINLAGQRSGPKRARRGAMAVSALALAAALAACSSEQPGSGASASDSGAASTPVATQAQAQAAASNAVDFEALEAKGYAIGDIMLGDPDAPVTLIEYASLTCPACKDFHDNTLPAVKRDYIDSGKVKMVVREMYRFRIGLYAAAIARCAGPDKYHAFLNVIFDRQDNFRTQDERANLEELRRIGKIGGLSPEAIDACLTDNAYLNALLQQNAEAIEADGVQATPWLIVEAPGGEREVIRGAAGASQLGTAIDNALGG
ncbi:MAG: thioredoxin domain-containing protein [Pseudomonadota bacterium]